MQLSWPGEGAGIPHLDDDGVFRGGEGLLVDGGSQLVVPPARTAECERQCRRARRPLIEMRARFHTHLNLQLFELL